MSPNQNTQHTKNTVTGWISPLFTNKIKTEKKIKLICFGCGLRIENDDIRFDHPTIQPIYPTIVYVLFVCFSTVLFYLMLFFHRLFEFMCFSSSCGWCCVRWEKIYPLNERRKDQQNIYRYPLIITLCGWLIVVAFSNIHLTHSWTVELIGCWMNLRPSNSYTILYKRSVSLYTHSLWLYIIIIIIICTLRQKKSLNLDQWGANNIQATLNNNFFSC